MPIRFRCAYCSQLMGIARRKAGTVVSCPKCHGQVVVPHPDPQDEEASSPRAPDRPQLFEGPDFDQVFATPEQAAAPEQHAPAVLVPASGLAPTMDPVPLPVPLRANSQEISFDVERLETGGLAGRSGPGAGRPGVWLTPVAITLLSLLALVLLALAFVGGLLLGRAPAG
jgi:hypothetical protein